jgi:hypothetical protein
MISSCHRSLKSFTGLTCAARPRFLATVWKWAEPVSEVGPVCVATIVVRLAPLTVQQGDDMQQVKHHRAALAHTRLVCAISCHYRHAKSIKDVQQPFPGSVVSATHTPDPYQ